MVSSGSNGHAVPAGRGSLLPAVLPSFVGPSVSMSLSLVRSGVDVAGSGASGSINGLQLVLDSSSFSVNRAVALVAAVLLAVFSLAPQPLSLIAEAAAKGLFP